MNRRNLFLSAKHQQDFLAFAVNTYHMHLANLWQTAQCVLYVEHGREFYQHDGYMSEQLVVNRFNIRRAVIQSNNLSSDRISSTGIKVNDVKMPHSIEIILTC